MGEDAAFTLTMGSKDTTPYGYQNGRSVANSQDSGPTDRSVFLDVIELLIGLLLLV